MARNVAAYFDLIITFFGQNCLSTPLCYFFFFFFRDRRSRSDGANSPIRIRHSERGSLFFFSYRTVSLRLPGSLTTPKGVVSHPEGCDNETFNAHTRVSCNLGLFEPVSGYFVRQGFGQNCSIFSFRIAHRRCAYNPSGSNFVDKIGIKTKIFIFLKRGFKLGKITILRSCRLEAPA